MSVLQKLAEKHDSWEDPNVLWSTAYNPPAPWWEAGVVTSWSHWEFGVDWERQYKEGLLWPEFWTLSISFGPWTAYLKREWGNQL